MIWHLVATFAPYLIGLMALFGVYARGHHNGRVAEGRDTLQRYAKQRKDADNADTGVGATDLQRVERLSEFSRKP